jgi:hypothetical protein
MLAILFCLTLPLLFIWEGIQSGNWAFAIIGVVLLAALLYNIWDGSDWS